MLAGMTVQGGALLFRAPLLLPPGRRLTILLSGIPLCTEDRERGCGGGSQDLDVAPEMGLVVQRISRPREQPHIY